MESGDTQERDEFDETEADHDHDHDHDHDDDAEPGRSTGTWTGGRWIIVLLLVASAVFAFSRVLAPSSAMAGWGHDWDQALQQSAKTGKPMMVLFTADWCPPCRSLKSEVFSDGDVSKYLKNEFSLMKVDLTDRGAEATQTAQTYGVRGIPTLIVFDAKGNQIDRMSGAGDKTYMMRWFQAASAKSRR